MQLYKTEEEFEVEIGKTIVYAEKRFGPETCHAIQEIFGREDAELVGQLVQGLCNEEPELLQVFLFMLCQGFVDAGVIRSFIPQRAS